MIKLLRVVSN